MTVELAGFRKFTHKGVVLQVNRRARVDAGLDDPPDLWFDVANFVAPPPNTYGDSGRGILTAPGTQTIDVSLSRAFPIKAFRLQLRVDALNLFNTPQFGFPNQNIGSPTAGRITTTLGDNRIDAVSPEARLVGERIS